MIILLPVCGDLLMENGHNVAGREQLTAKPTINRRRNTHGSTSTWDRQPLSRVSWLLIERMVLRLLKQELSVQTYMWATTVCLMKTLPVEPILNHLASTHAVERLAGISEFTKENKRYSTSIRSELTPTQQTRIKTTNTWHRRSFLVKQAVTLLNGKPNYLTLAVTCQ